MNFKQKLAYMALGCLFTIIGYIIASLGGDVNVQAQGDKSSPTVVDEIVCRKLKVVNADGKTVVLIHPSAYGGEIVVSGDDGNMAVLIGTVTDYGYIDVFHPNGRQAVMISSVSGASMHVCSADGKRAVSITPGGKGILPR